LHHFHHHDTQTPNIDLDTVVVSTNEFRSLDYIKGSQRISLNRKKKKIGNWVFVFVYHPVGSSDNGVSLLLLLRELRSVAKISWKAKRRVRPRK
jgi:hypothetical protein